MKLKRPKLPPIFRWQYVVPRLAVVVAVASTLPASNDDNELSSCNAFAVPSARGVDVGSSASVGGVGGGGGGGVGSDGGGGGARNISM